MAREAGESGGGFGLTSAPHVGPPYKSSVEALGEKWISWEETAGRLILRSFKRSLEWVMNAVQEAILVGSKRPVNIITCQGGWTLRRPIFSGLNCFNM